LASIRWNVSKSMPRGVCVRTLPSRPTESSSEVDPHDFLLSVDATVVLL
jgi:hypothetical protein